MTVIPDHQFGIDLRLRKPAGPPNRQQLDGMVRDLLGADQSLLAPLRHLIGNPSFLTLDPANASKAERQCTRDQLLADMADTYHPKVVERLRAFLDGYFDLAPTEGALFDAPVIWGGDPPVPSASSQQQPAPPSPSASATPTAPLPQAVPPLATVRASTTGFPTGLVPQPPPAPAASSEPTPSTPVGSTSSALPAPAPPVPPSSDPNTSPEPSRIPLVLGLSLLAGLGVGLTYRLPALCRPLGLCLAASPSTPLVYSASTKALDRAQQAADAMGQARSLASYESALTNLDKELLRLSGDPLTPAQVAQRDRLQGVARDGHQRIKQENKEATAVEEAKGRIDDLPSLPSERQATEREIIRGDLSSIPARSFSYGDAQALLKRLSAPTEPPKSQSEAPAEPDPQAPTSVPTPPPVSPAPTPRRDWSSGERSWSPPRREAPSTPQSRPVPAPAPQEDSGSNAPHRDDPLF